MTVFSLFLPVWRLFRWAAILPVILCVLAHPAAAQAQKADRLDATAGWSDTARRAEEALQSGLASSEAFEVLRSELAQQRADADAAAEAGGLAIRLLKAQIETLGPSPGKDQPEPEKAAQRRKALSDALDAAEAPVAAARLASARANVLIEEIDRLIRTRSAEDLMARKPSPLLPSSWKTTATELGKFATRLSEETARYAALNPDEAEIYDNRLIIALGILLGALLLPVGVGHYGLIQLERRVTAPPNTLRFILQAGGVHIMRLVVSLVAVALVIAAVLLAEWGITSTANLSGAILGVTVIFVVASWIGNVLFTPNQPALRLVGLSDGLARTCYWLSIAFATALGMDALVDGATEDYPFSAPATSVLQGISILIGCIVLSGLARVLFAVAREAKVDKDALEDTPFGPGFFVFSGYAIQALAALSIVAASLGYVPLARAGLAPTMLSLTIFGLAFILHHGVMMPVRAAMADRQSSVELVSMLLGILILVVSLPLLAMAWGAREAELGEIWRLIQNGIDFGGVRLSPRVLIVLGGTLAVGVFLTRWVQRVTDRVILPKTQIDSGARNAIKTGLGYVGFILSTVLAISAAGLDLSNLAIIAGALSVGVGFGMQTIVSNFVSGIILLIERPIKEGDWIEVSGFSGTVRKIAVRSTRIETFDRHDVIIPNADLIAGTVKNMTLSSQIGRMILPIGIAYGSDVERATTIMLEVANDHSGVLSYPQPQVFFRNFGNNALDFELRCFLRDVGTEISVRSDLLYALNAALAAAGIEIPFAQSDVTIRNLDQILAQVSGKGQGKEQETLPADSPQPAA
ncbi:DUF3772 domain-containing protein [Allorhizobium pseudoryzae]|uniref:DUF3772 domain-containing protein n=1 Tax=Allorhizobium pseudoryzae TaxID=379684 RepID=UPI003CFC2276